MEEYLCVGIKVKAQLVRPGTREVQACDVACDRHLAKSGCSWRSISTLAVAEQHNLTGCGW